MRTLLVALLIAYLVGSVPFVYLFCMWMKGIDPRTVGDANPGAKNAFLHVGKAPGIIAGICDIFKGLVVILAAKWLGLEQLELFAVGVAVVMGHNYPVLLNFQGGQGMATTVGVLLGIAPEATLVGAICFLIGMLILRHWNLACAIGFAMVPITSYFWRNDIATTAYSVMLIPVIGIRKLIQDLTGWAARHRKGSD